MPIGKGPLSYLGVVADNPPQFIVINRAPTANDFINFNLGTIWLQKNTENLWLLTSMAGGVATWTPFGMNAGGDEFDTDAGNAVPVAGVLNIFGGANINTAGAGNTVTVNLNTSILQPDTSADALQGMYSLGGNTFMHNFGTQNTFLGSLAGNLTTTGTGRNTGIGLGSLNGLTTGTSNTALGAGAGSTLTTGSNNTFVGDSAGTFVITGSDNIFVGNGSGAGVPIDSQNNILIGAEGRLFENNVIRIQKRAATPIVGTSNIFFGAVAGNTVGAAADENIGIGKSSLELLTTGTNNVAVGFDTLLGINTGSNNIALGDNAGNALASTESSNILIGNTGIVADNNTIRMGTYNATPGAGEQNKCYIAACYSNFGTQNTFVGEQAGNTTTAGSSNTAIGYQALDSIGLDPDVTVGNVAIGAHALTNYTGSTLPITGGNTAIGVVALNDATVIDLDTAIGWNSMARVTTGSRNTAIGASALSQLTTGSFNVGIGEGVGVDVGAGTGLVTGSRNLLIGTQAGDNFTNAESDNVHMGNAGVTGENNTMRLGGTTGTGNFQQNRCFIAGIRGITTGVNDAIAVLIDSAGQLGTVSSSARYKDNIVDMGSVSEGVYNLRPVTFTYKDDRAKNQHVGLIAEEVDKIFPGLVVYDKEGRPETVKYHDMPVLLLNEIQKLRARIEELEKRVQ